MAKRISKHITDKEKIKYILSLKEEELDKSSIIMELFGDFGDDSNINPYDTIDIPVDSYGPKGKRNKNAFRTTVGLWVFNKYFIETDFFELFGYINKTINKSTINMINEKMSYAVLEDKVELSILKKYIMKTQKYQPYINILTPNHSMDMLLITEKINKKKKELLGKYKPSELNETIITEMEIELLNFAKEELKDDPALDMFLSGAKGSFGNNFKNLFIMRGVIKDPDPTKGFNLITSSYMDGITKDEYVAFSNSLASGPYARSKKTEIGGYWEKLFLSAFQHVKLLDKDSDCGTSRTINIAINKENISTLMYCFISNNGRLVRIESANASSFIGKTVKLRFASLCEAKQGICNKCAGDLFYMLGIMNIGTATPQIPSKLKNLSMKSFHDSSVQLVEMNPMEAFGFE